MKKVSTAAGKATRNFSQPKLTIGLDLGDRSSWYCLLDEVGEVLQEKKLATTPKAMREVFGSMPRCRIALETGTHSPWVSRLLSELGHEAIVAHARNVRLIGESRKKDDRLVERFTNRCGIVTRCRCRRQHKVKIFLGRKKQKPKAEFR
jgi:transposase